MIIKNRVAAAAAAVFMLAASAAAQAQSTLTVNVAGIGSFADFGSPANVSKVYSLGAGAHITGISFNVSITAFAPSFLQEISVALYSSTSVPVGYAPDGVTNSSGTGSYSKSFDLISDGRDFTLNSDGLLNLQFYDDYFDEEVTPNGIWNSGTLSILYTPAAVTAPIPEPGTYALMLAGLGVLGWAARRRSV